MRPATITYHRPATIAETCELGRSLGPTARFLAGGTELLVDLRSGRDTAEHLIDLTRVAELQGVVAEGRETRIGALTRLADVAASPEVRRNLPALGEAIGKMAGVQIRNQATIGGNFCGAVPCADTPPVCIASEARLHIVGPEGERMLPAEAFITAPRVNALEEGELLAAIVVPEQPANSGASYQRFGLRRGSALAVASVAARITLQAETIADARVVLGAVAPLPLFVPQCTAALTGRAPSDEAFEEAARIAASSSQPISDLRGSQGFRRDIVATLTLRALREAAARARDAAAGRSAS